MKHLLQFELIKCFNRKRAAVSFLLVVGFVAMILVGLWLQDRRHGQRRVADATFSDYLNAPMCVLVAESPGLFLFLPILAAIMGASQVAGEWQAGTLRTMMIRPVSRGGVLLAKFAVLGVYLLLLVAWLFSLTFLMGWAWFGKLGSLIVPQVILGQGNGFIILPADIAIHRLLFSYLLAAVSLWSLASLGLLFGVILEQTATAAMAALGVYFISHIISATGLFTELQRYLPTHHWNWWNRVYVSAIPWPDLLQHGLWIAAYTVACLGLSIGLFLRKDIHS